MCGISGIISKTPVTQKKFSGLNHRGPDAFGKLHTEHCQKHIHLNHWRLSIVDLSDAGKQPMATADGSCTLIYNGEVYNFAELKRAHLSAYSFNSLTDTEVLLYLYDMLGSSAFNYLNGDFALAILDKKRNKVILARDRMGVKPLYFYKDDRQCVFASEIKAIKEYGVNLQLQSEQLENYFVFKYVPEENTLFKNVYRLRPGHFLEIDLQTMHISEEPYWQLQKKDEFAGLSYKDAVHQVRDIVNSAVNMQLMADVPVGTFFSGGLDSSIIAWCIKDHKEITHYTAQKSREDLKNEGSTSDFFYAQKLANDWQLNLVPVEIGSHEANPALINKTLYYSDDLIADGSQIPSYLISAEAGKKSRVLLSGMGADELFYGYAGHQISLLSLYMDRFPGFIKTPFLHLMSSLNPGKGFFKPYKRFLQKLGRYQSHGKLNYGMLNIVGDYSNSQQVLKQKNDTALSVFKKYFSDAHDVFDAVSRFEFNNFLVKNLHYLDRMCMANAVEGRVPFMDYRIVELAYSLPRHYKLSSPANTKSILKDAFGPYLPGYIINRRKAGFGMPLRSIFIQKTATDSLLDFEMLNDLGYFSVENIRGLIANHQQGREDNSALIYALVSFQEWYKLNFN